MPLSVEVISHQIILLCRVQQDQRDFMTDFLSLNQLNVINIFFFMNVSLQHAGLSPGDHEATRPDCQLWSRGSGTVDSPFPLCPSTPGRSSGLPKGEEPANYP